MKIFSVGNYQAQTQIQNCKNKNVNNYSNQKAFGMRILEPGEIAKAPDAPLTRFKMFLGEKYDELVRILTANQLTPDRVVSDYNDPPDFFTFVDNANRELPDAKQSKQALLDKFVEMVSETLFTQKGIRQFIIPPPPKS